MAMSAHPQLSTTDAAEMVKYILSVSGEAAASTSLPAKGSYTATLPEGDKGKGIFIVRAAYEDKGANGLPSLRSEQTLVLRNAKVDVHGLDLYDFVNKMSYGGNNLAIPSKSGAYMALKGIDLNGVTEVRVTASAPRPQLNARGGKVELRLGSSTGQVIGESSFLEPSDKMDFKPNLLSVPVNAPAAPDQKLQDVYLVFVNPNEPMGSLMVVSGVEFILK
jgi:cytochrome c